MRRPRQPLFLARDVYRRRRLHDAARMLPVVGAFLLILPLFWTGTTGGGAVVFVFLVWALLILAAAFLAPGLQAPEADGTEGGPD
jgi:hypothetical protein